MTNAQKGYIHLLAKWYYLSPKQIQIFFKKELKTIQNQLLIMHKQKYLKRVLQPYTNEYVYTPTYKAYRLADLNHWKEKNINLYTFNHTQAIIDYIAKHDIKEYKTERELISELYANGRPNSTRTPDLVAGDIAYEFELTFKSKVRYQQVQEYIDKQLDKGIYKKWIWICNPSFKNKLKKILMDHTLEEEKYFEFEDL